ncbi:MAG: class I SAM-dependent methyltransferase [Nanoarchaeota archaeon]
MNNTNTNREKLAKRIETHEKYSKYDINKWIFGILKIKGKESVLDVGCGTGKQLIPIAEKTKNLVVGVDVNKESLEYIKNAIGQKPNVKLVISSMEEMYEKLRQYPKFDVIISCFAIYYAKKPEETLLQLKELLKDNGRLFICGPGINNNKGLLDLHAKIGKLPKMHKGFFENFAIPFLRHNFKNVEASIFKNPISFPNFNSLLEYWLSYSIGDKNKVEKFTMAAQAEFRDGKRFTTTKEVIGILAFN